jgi:adenine specific DNA methylase Mod
MADNKLYYGDNLHILRQYVPDESVDLIYLDPPFNSNQNYNVLFKEENGTASAAQVHAFTDTWKWNDTSEEALNDITENAPSRLVELIKGFLAFLGRNQFTAYLVMMAPRLLELHRVLKPTGSIYLHCDPTASHYLKIILDQIFDVRNFQNEIIWKRSYAHSDTKQGRKGYGNLTDIILYYAKGSEFIFNTQYRPNSQEYIKNFYKYMDSDGRRYRLVDTTGPGGAAKGNPHYEVMGVWRYWRYSQEKMNKLIAEGRIIQTKPGNVPQFKQYLDDMPGVPLQNLWDDINPISSMAKERLGYPTQKPEALLERIVQASSNEGDIILDPFCGCGTTIVASEKLNRRWIGIDITHLAIALMKSRLQDTFGDSAKYDVVGEPTDLSGAHALARQDRYQFQWWALSLVKARPVDQNQKKGADKGIDGIKYINITPGLKKPQTIKVVVQVKSGHVQVKDVREFKTVIENTKSEMGLFVTLDEPTAPMTQEALSSGYYKPSGIVGAKSCPKVQILTIEELLNGKKVQYPMHDDVTFRRAGKVEDEEAKNLEIDFSKDS